MGKPKMWNIWKTANRRAKRIKISDSGRGVGVGGTTVQICRVLLMPDCISLVWGHWGHLGCTLQNFQFKIFLKLCSSHNFHHIHPNFIQGIIII